MRIVAFNGSPRGEQGNTHVMVREFLTGAAEAGADVENVFLAGKDIKHCRGCLTCWIGTPGKCVIKDDMAELIEQFLAADVVIFATPVYTDAVTGMTKTFMDRMIPIMDPHFEPDEHGETRHVMRYEKYPKLAVISNCGYPEQTHFQVLSLLFARLARNMHSEVIAEIYRAAGPLFEIKMPIVEPLLGEYKQLLRRAGREVVEHGRLSDATRVELDKPLVPADVYREQSNQGWDRALARIGGA